MRELIQADLKRVIKDKLLLVLAILAVVFALITPLTFALVFSVIDVSEEPMLAALVSAKGLFFQSFSMTNNMGFIAPILLAIVLYKDFSYGTVRNKIISGKSRSQIFLSTFIVCSLVLVCLIMLSAFITLGVSLIFFDYQEGAFAAADLGYFFASLGFELLVLLFMSALLSLLCTCSKNLGIAIVLYLAFTFALTLVGSFTQVIGAVAQTFVESELLTKVINVIDRLNVGMSTSYIGTGDSYSLSDVLYLTLPALSGIAAFLGLGLVSFNKKDLK
ncbi:MAG: ABC transporter permease subunit [Clostridia bacterium]|nr:ABC transporter permease subunit [Clostridia bacterium]